MLEMHVPRRLLGQGGEVLLLLLLRRRLRLTHRTHTPGRAQAAGCADLRGVRVRRVRRHPLFGDSADARHDFLAAPLVQTTVVGHVRAASLAVAAHKVPRQQPHALGQVLHHPPHRAEAQLGRGLKPPVTQEDAHSLDRGDGHNVGQAVDHPLREEVGDGLRLDPGPDPPKHDGQDEEALAAHRLEDLQRQDPLEQHIVNAALLRDAPHPLKRFKRHNRRHPA
mmetsp:Transcript_36341/g.85269  ORF Transcript_36341/g.85269 Transcript_36341/m.85269 type:complete len:223 (-) Transcript_36341:160-828(-)